LGTRILKGIFGDIGEEGAVCIKLAVGMASTVPCEHGAESSGSTKRDVYLM